MKKQKSFIVTVIELVILVGAICGLVFFLTTKYTPKSQETVKGYTIYLDANGGKLNDEETKQTDENGKLTELPTAPTRAEYEFVCWSYDKAIAYAITTDTVFYRDTVVYAYWQKEIIDPDPDPEPTPDPDPEPDDETYIITFDPNGGELTSEATMTTDKNGRLTSLPSAPTRIDHVFACWSMTPTEDVEVTTSTVFTHDTTVYAYWLSAPDPTPEVYTVTYDLNGGSGATPTQDPIAAETSIILASANGITKQGYDFGGWNDGVNVYAANATYIMPAHDVTLTAVWKETIPETFTVTYELNGGSGITPIQSPMPANANITVASANGITKQGYNFSGWSDGVNIHAANTTYKMPSHNVVFTAVWSKIPDPTPEPEPDPEPEPNDNTLSNNVLHIDPENGSYYYEYDEYGVYKASEKNTINIYETVSGSYNDNISVGFGSGYLSRGMLSREGLLSDCGIMFLVADEMYLSCIEYSFDFDTDLCSICYSEHIVNVHFSITITNDCSALAIYDVCAYSELSVELSYENNGQNVEGTLSLSSGFWHSYSEVMYLTTVEIDLFRAIDLTDILTVTTTDGAVTEDEFNDYFVSNSLFELTLRNLVMYEDNERFVAYISFSFYAPNYKISKLILELENNEPIELFYENDDSPWRVVYDVFVGYGDEFFNLMQSLFSGNSRVLLTFDCYDVYSYMESEANTELIDSGILTIDTSDERIVYTVCVDENNTVRLRFFAVDGGNFISGYFGISALHICGYVSDGASYDVEITDKGYYAVFEVQFELVSGMSLDIHVIIDSFEEVYIG